MFTAEEVAQLDAMSLEDKLKFYAERKRLIAKQRPAESVPPAARSEDHPEVAKGADINARNKVFWAKYNADRDELIERYRPLLKSPEDVIALMGGHAESVDADAKYKAETTRRNSRAASRPRKKSDFKGVVVNAMRLFRRGGRTLGDFIDSAENGGIGSLSIELTVPADHPHDRKYEIRTDDDDGCERSFRTLEDYWSAAGKN